MAATLSPPGESAYDASKAALAVFSEAMAVDLWDTGVKVTVVYPGVVDTELFTLPDNDPFTGDVAAITVDEAAGPSWEASPPGPLGLRARHTSPSSPPTRPRTSTASWPAPPPTSRRGTEAASDG